MRFRELIQEEMVAQRVTKRQLAGRLGVTPSAVHQILCGDRSPTFATMGRYASALGCDLRLELVPKDEWLVSVSDVEPLTETAPGE
jgi:transcriptional regulator with XRE-family HTH domain